MALQQQTKLFTATKVTLMLAKSQIILLDQKINTQIILILSPLLNYFTITLNYSTFELFLKLTKNMIEF